MKKIFLTASLLIALVIGNLQFSHAQTVINNWVTLPTQNGASSIIIDDAGYLYVANTNLNTISKIAPDGTLTAAWATLPSGSGPIGLAFDAQGNIYSANNLSYTISKISASGAVTPVWANLGATNIPFGITVDPSGNVFTVSNSNSKITRISPSGTISMIWTAAVDSRPVDILSDASGVVYVTNSNVGSISKIPGGNIIIEPWAFVGHTSRPFGITMDASGNLYTSNFNNVNSTVSKIASDGTTIAAWAVLANGSSPYHLIVDPLGNIYTSNLNKTISKITADGTVTQDWATLTTNGTPYDLVMDASGNIYVIIGNSITKIEPGSPLPTKLKGFTGDLKSGTATLYWKSGVEANLNHYELEKSTDGNKFSLVDKIAPKGSDNEYRYSMPQMAQTAYYRLKLIDNDGHSEFSDVYVVSKNGDNSSNISIYPVPSKNKVTVRVDHSGKLSIYSMAGQFVKTVDLKKGLNEISISSLTSGTYIGKINGQTMKFIKQ